jgi:hypothetical protein
MTENIKERKDRELFRKGYSELKDFNGNLFSISAFERFKLSVENEF